MEPLLIGAAALGLVVGFLVGFQLHRSQERTRQEQLKASATDESSRILNRAKDEASNLRKAGELEGKQAAIQLRESWEAEESRRREELERAERRAEERADGLDRKFDVLNERAQKQEARGQEHDERTDQIRDREAELVRSEEEARRRLEALAGMSSQ